MFYFACCVNVHAGYAVCTCHVDGCKLEVEQQMEGGRNICTVIFNLCICVADVL